MKSEQKCIQLCSLGHQQTRYNTNVLHVNSKMNITHLFTQGNTGLRMNDTRLHMTNKNPRNIMVNGNKSQKDTYGKMSFTQNEIYIVLDIYIYFWNFNTWKTTKAEW